MSDTAGELKDIEISGSKVPKPSFDVRVDRTDVMLNNLCHLSVSSFFRLPSGPEC
jgi:hypothetical protein